MKIKHVVYSHREGLRWFFVDTRDQKLYFLSLDPRDIKYLILGGIHILVPPLTTKHINGTWSK